MAEKPDDPEKAERKEFIKGILDEWWSEKIDQAEDRRKKKQPAKGGDWLFGKDE